MHIKEIISKPLLHQTSSGRPHYLEKMLMKTGFYGYPNNSGIVAPWEFLSSSIFQVARS